MKLISILLFALLMQVNTKGYSQKVTLNLVNANLEEVLLNINKQTGISYSASDKLLKKGIPLTIHISNVDIEQALQICFKNQPLSYSINDKIIIIKEKKIKIENNSTHNPINVKGRIINEKNEPVLANVTVKGTGNGTSTDTHGGFFLNSVDANGVLVITGVGIETFEVKIENRNDLSTLIAATKSVEVEGVVVNTGYESKSPNKINGSVSVIDNKVLNQQTGPNIIQRLEGVANGLLFNVGKTDASGKKNQLSVRGLSTINASTAPLIIWDNFPFEGSIENINPNDVESVTILKDAAATSIYGVRGGNGVIVITSKRAKFNQKVHSELNSNIIIAEQPNIYYLPRISTNDYIDVEQFLLDIGYDFGGRLYSNYLSITPIMDIFLKRKAGLISVGDSLSQVNSLRQIDNRKQIDKYVYSSSLLQQYSLNVRGGGSNIAWIISGSYNRSLSSLDSKSDKVNVRINNLYKPFSNGEVSISVYYTNANSNSGKQTPDNLFLRRAPYIMLADVYGSPLSVPNKYRDSYTDTAGGGELLNWKRFPLDDYKHDISKGRREEIVADISFKYKIIKGVDLGLFYQYQRQFVENSRLADMQSFYTRDIINSYTNLNVPLTLPQLRNPIPLGDILTTSNSVISSNNFRIQLNIEREIRRHYFSGITGFEVRDVTGLGGNTSTIYGFSQNPILNGRVDFNNEYPDLVTGIPSTIPGSPNYSAKTLNRYVSLYSNWGYTLNKKYSINFSIRKDASNIFGLNANDKWTPLWSSGIGWNISQEEFYGIQKIPLLKLKATFGYSGNVDLSRTALVILNFASGGQNAAGYPYAFVSTPTNKNLKWEKVYQFNLGVDFASNRNRVSGSLEFYEKRGFNLYGITPFDYTAFGNSVEVIKNVAEMKGTGVDFQLITRNVEGSFNWTTNLIFNYNLSKTTKYFGGGNLNGESLVSASGSIITPTIGKPLYAIAAYKFAGLDEFGNPRGYLEDKLSTDYASIVAQNGIYNNGIEYIGSSNPLFSFYLNNQISWHNKVTFSINIIYKGGYYFRKPTISYKDLVEQGIGHADYEKRWKVPGDESTTTIPSFMFPVNGNRDLFYKLSEVNVLKADNIKIKYINIGYFFNSHSQLYLNLADAGIIWRANKVKIDPDYPDSIPPSKSFTMGLKITF